MNMNTEPKMIGYTENLPIKKGDKVRIKKGTMIRTTRDYSLEKSAGKTFVVNVHHTLPGMNYPKDDFRHDKSYRLENPRVVWVGAGGYWHEADMNEVEKVSELEIFVYSRR